MMPPSKRLMHEPTAAMCREAKEVVMRKLLVGVIIALFAPLTIPVLANAEEDAPKKVVAKKKVAKKVVKKTAKKTVKKGETKPTEPTE